MTTIEKIELLINGSQNFGVFLNRDPEDHEFLAKEILKRTINKRGYPVLDLPADNLELTSKWQSLTSPFDVQLEFPKKTSIKLPREKYGIKEVSYKEQKDGDLSLIVTSQNSPLLNEDLLIEELPPEIDVVFCLFNNSEKLENFKSQAKLPPNDKVVFLTSEGKTLTQKIFEITKLFDNNALDDPEINSLLFAALTTETNNFSEKIDEENLSFASSLLAKGADKAGVFKLLEKEKKTSVIQLLGRILARTYTDEISNISWSFLNQRDIQKTGNAPTSVLFMQKMINKIKPFLPPLNLHILLWQSETGINATSTFGTARNENYLEAMAEKIGAKAKNRFLTLGPFENFSKAEIYMREKLR